MHRLKFCLFMMAIAIPVAVGLPERVISIGLGAGLPQIAALQGQVMAAHHWQIGFGFGLLPSGVPVMPNVSIPSQSINTPNFGTVTLTPTVSPLLNTLTPYIRYFPTDRNFYIEFAYALYRLNLNVSSTLSGGGGMIDLSGSGIGGTVTLLQAMPTISLGHLFMSKAFYFNLSLGASLVGSISTSTSLSSSVLPAGIPASDSQAITDGASAGISKAAQDAINQFSKNNLLIPSMMLTFGIEI